MAPALPLRRQPIFRRLAARPRPEKRKEPTCAALPPSLPGPRFILSLPSGTGKTASLSAPSPGSSRCPAVALPAPLLRTDILELKDLKPGMKLRGTVRNVVDFGAFVDIGVHQDGLVHISRLSDNFVRKPSDVVRVGDVVDVAVVEVDAAKKRIALSMLAADVGRN